MSLPEFERRSSPARAREGRLRILRKIFVVEFVEAVIAAVIVAACLRLFVVSVYRIPSESMMPTLVPGDFIVVWKTSYGLKLPGFDRRFAMREPERGDVVVFQLEDDGALYVKRVAAVSGDRIEIRNGELLVNDIRTAVPLGASGDSEFSEETNGKITYRVMRRNSSEEADFLAPQIVSPGEVFLLGDLRSESTDSRQWGAISTSLIVGRAALIAASIEIQGAPIPPPGVLKTSRLSRTFQIIE